MKTFVIDKTYEHKALDIEKYLLYKRVSRLIEN